MAPRSTTATMFAKQNTALTTSSLCQPILRVEPDTECAGVRVLSWDTEGGSKAQTNLLRTSCSLDLRVRTAGVWKNSEEFETQVARSRDGIISYKLAISAGAELEWLILTSSGSLIMTVFGRGDRRREIEAIEMRFPFDLKVTPTTLLAKIWDEEESGKLPAVISSPDFGQLLLEGQFRPATRFRLEGNRQEQTLDVILELSGITNDEPCTLTLTPMQLSR